MGEFLTRLTVWMAVCAYAIGVAMILRGRGRGVWTLGCALFLAHVACAFTYYHHWSHDDAYAETARQTAEMTGFQSGAGLYLNYLVALVGLADVLWWWLMPETRARRPRWLECTLHAFMFFMVLNGAVIFASGPLRWLGLLLCIGVIAAWTQQPRSLARERTD